MRLRLSHERHDVCPQPIVRLIGGASRFENRLKTADQNGAVPAGGSSGKPSVIQQSGVRRGTAMPSVMSGPRSSGDQTMLLPFRFQVVASMSFMPLLHSDRVLHFVFGLLLPLVGSAMLARPSRFIFGRQAASKQMDDLALRCREQGAIGTVKHAFAFD